MSHAKAVRNIISKISGKQQDAISEMKESMTSSKLVRLNEIRS